ncbi:MAG: hypothetical protein RIB67_08975 [Miltoncostaeaceae bacterium]
MAELRITEYTDPGCPWGFSAEPARRRLMWLYGEQIAWDLRMVGLATTGEEFEARGFTPQEQSRAFSRIASEHGMPIDDALRPRMAGTAFACRTVVAVRLHDPANAREVSRRISMRHFAGRLIDEPQTIMDAVVDAGLDPGQVAGWTAEEPVGEALAADMVAARTPSPAALAQPERLADWEGGRRYTCPAYEIERLSDGATMSVPGFQPVRSYEMAIANLAPHLTRAADPEDPAAVLARFPGPLATIEVAGAMGLSRAEVRSGLERSGASFDPVGFDGYWSLG